MTGEGTLTENTAGEEPKQHSEQNLVRKQVLDCAAKGKSYEGAICIKLLLKWYVQYQAIP